MPLSVTAYYLKKMEYMRFCLCVQSRNAYSQGLSLSGGNYNVSIRDKVCCSQLELGFNWAAVIGLLHLKVEFNTTANFCCEVTQ